ncbi:hypothetical protein AXF42_Ash020164 [Apostasia shenzhenica]|uniref:SAP domain-containing protein n=1 Tax=Apostasia shenzhenica TaxID=1088818 RepID=A0A2H9ZVU7_9ASPA|nr:hypothetical protein AXF42_Ash020164 [Apostasia shenzhenica]
MEDEGCDSRTPATKPAAELPAEPQVKANSAFKHLTNLPSRGLFSSTTLSSNLGSTRVYVCDHDTSPPEDQLIKTNTTNILIRSLQINKQRNDTKDAKAVTENSKGKRCAARPLDGRSSAKRANTSGASGSGWHEGTSSGSPESLYQTMTVERLRSLLKKRGLSPKGKKDELIARLKGAS